jgi:subtilase family serine protease
MCVFARAQNKFMQSELGLCESHRWIWCDTLVDAFHYPTALTDLQTFSAQFGVKAPNLTVVFASGVKPAQDPTGGWELEAALDLQWAHAMAPDARLFLVEARSNSFSDLLTAERVAGNLVASAGGGEVSNSGSDSLSACFFYSR